jgi:hypothetical protein
MTIRPHWIAELQRQQQKLLHLHYQGSIDVEVLAVEQACIDRERADAASGLRLPTTMVRRSWVRFTRR